MGSKISNGDIVESKETCFMCDRKSDKIYRDRGDGKFDIVCSLCEGKIGEFTPAERTDLRGEGFAPNPKHIT